MRRTLLVLLTAAAVGVVGCADRQDAPATPQNVPHSYRADLENTVVLAIRRDTDEAELLRQIGIVAGRHDLGDWRAEEDSYVAIGAGLQLAGAAQDQAAAVAELVSGGDEARRRQVLQVYGGSR
ncbi:MAG: hypothetical protein KJP17_09125 [Gammaproteobacteria bacterium]|nr:hypothetical protein [Gammaproteobacteria bacterium]